MSTSYYLLSRTVVTLVWEDELPTDDVAVEAPDGTVIETKMTNLKTCDQYTAHAAIKFGIGYYEVSPAQRKFAKMSMFGDAYGAGNDLSELFKKEDEDV